MTNPTLLRRPSVGLSPAWAGISPLLAQVLAARGATPDQHNLTLQHLATPTLKGIDRAAEILADAIRGGRRIVVAGDYDCDGGTGTTVGVLGLRALGATSVDFVVPDRFTMGYGLSVALVDLAMARGAEVIVTVDSGISSLAGVQAARQRGATVVITDHHLAGPVLPDADAIVNPNQPGCDFASKALAGVGCLFYTLLATRARLKADGWFLQRPEANLVDLLELVAVGTVADVVPLDYNNRIMVQHGLRRLRAGAQRPGLRALIEVSGTDPRYLTSTDLGFRLGPRINAAGRLKDMTIGIRCMLTDDPGEALDLAKQLDSLNRQRKNLQEDMSGEALMQVAAGQDGRTGVVVYDASWHEGIVGLIASRVKESTHRPAVALAAATEPGMIKGSCRSIPGLHIRDALAMVDARNPGLLEKFGGHAMAAGLSFRAAHLDKFTAEFDKACSELATPEILTKTLLTDGSLDPQHLTVESAELLEAAGPWGQCFQEPVWEGRFQVRSHKLMGSEDQHVRYGLTVGNRNVTAVHFNGAADLRTSGSMDAAFKLSVNRWNGNKSLQLMIESRI